MTYTIEDVRAMCWTGNTPGARCARGGIGCPLTHDGRPASLWPDRRRARRRRRGLRVGLAALALLGAAWLVASRTQAHAAADPHDHLQLPSPARLATLYPDLTRRAAGDARELRAMRRSRWRSTHPAAVAAQAVHDEADRYRAQFLCIARHESGLRWDVSTGNGYYGGLQMDRTFQATYAPGLYRRKGTADRWTEDEQIAAAGRAVPGRGFTPWPNTARMCGLL